MSGSLLAKSFIHDILHRNYDKAKSKLSQMRDYDIVHSYKVQNKEGITESLSLLDFCLKELTYFPLSKYNINNIEQLLSIVVKLSNLPTSRELIALSAYAPSSPLRVLLPLIANINDMRTALEADHNKSTQAKERVLRSKESERAFLNFRDVEGLNDFTAGFNSINGGAFYHFSQHDDGFRPGLNVGRNGFPLDESHSAGQATREAQRKARQDKIDLLDKEIAVKKLELQKEKIKFVNEGSYPQLGILKSELRKLFNRLLSQGAVDRPNQYVGETPLVFEAYRLDEPAIFASLLKYQQDVLSLVTPVLDGTDNYRHVLESIAPNAKASNYVKMMFKAYELQAIALYFQKTLATPERTQYIDTSSRLKISLMQDALFEILLLDKTHQHRTRDLLAQQCQDFVVDLFTRLSAHHYSHDFSITQSLRLKMSNHNWSIKIKPKAVSVYKDFNQIFEEEQILSFCTSATDTLLTFKSISEEQVRLNLKKLASILVPEPNLRQIQDLTLKLNHCYSDHYKPSDPKTFLENVVKIIVDFFYRIFTHIKPQRVARSVTKVVGEFTHAIKTEHPHRHSDSIADAHYVPGGPRF